MNQPPAGYPYWPGPPPPPVSPGGVPLADFGTRLLAYVIDSALLGAVVMAVGTPLFFVMFFRYMPDPTGVADSDYNAMWPVQLIGPLLLLELVLVLFSLVLYYFYAVEYMHRSGQTLGKRLMAVRVVPLDPAQRLTRGMAARRFLVENVVGVVVPFFALLDGLWQLWDQPYLQALHDKAAGTVVVKVLP